MVDILPDTMIRVGGHLFLKIAPVDGLDDLDNLSAFESERRRRADRRTCRIEALCLAEGRFDGIQIIGRLAFFSHETSHSTIMVFTRW